jgi:hypothetical protein
VSRRASRADLSAQIGDLEQQNERLRLWIQDLQAGCYVNCVYCGHRYGPGETTPVSMADALKAHVEQCPQHPMSELREMLDEAAPFLRQLASQCEGCEGSGEIPRASGPAPEDEYSEPCKHCEPIWKLIERIEPARPAPVPVPAAVQEEDDDIPF